MFYNAFKHGKLAGEEAKEVGRRYCEYVLKPGGSEDEMGMLKKFLGREPSMAAFCKQYGVEMQNGL